MKSSPDKNLQRLLKNLQRQFGAEALQCFSDAAQSRVPTFSSGSVALDRALGGGFPRGRIVEVFGRESSGKTSICLHAIAEAQKSLGLTAFVDAEHALDVAYAHRLGVDVERLLVSQPDSGEQALALTEALIGSGEVSLVVVDSVAALTPLAEINGEIGDQHVGLQARLMAQAMRKLTAHCHRHSATILFVNQIRHKIGVTFGSSETTPGGNALKFFSSVRLQSRRVSTVKNKEGAPIGIEIGARVVKNKVAPPFREARFELRYDRGIHRELEIVSLGIEHDVLKLSGSWVSIDGERLGQGRERAAELLREQPELAESVMARIPPPAGFDLAPRAPSPDAAPVAQAA